MTCLFVLNATVNCFCRIWHPCIPARRISAWKQPLPIWFILITLHLRFQQKFTFCESNFYIFLLGEWNWIRVWITLPNRLTDCVSSSNNSINSLCMCVLIKSTGNGDECYVTLENSQSRRRRTHPGHPSPRVDHRSDCPRNSGKHIFIQFLKKKCLN